MNTAGRLSKTIPAAMLVAFVGLISPTARAQTAAPAPLASPPATSAAAAADGLQPTTANPPPSTDDQPTTPLQATPIGDQQTSTPDQPGLEPSDSGSVNDNANRAGGRKGDRIFGMIPNNTTVEGASHIAPIPVSEKFKLGAENAFDPFVYVFVGITASLAEVDGAESSFGRSGGAYAKRYAVAFADNTINGMMTSSVFPSLLKQDPRYFQLGEGSTPHRIGYAASRILITRSDGGHRQFNLSEVGGNVAAAGIAEAYYPPEDRTAIDLVERWAMNVMWDTLSNELKEFWPDIRRRIRKQ